jgi:hypothetical protein
MIFLVLTNKKNDFLPPLISFGFNSRGLPRFLEETLKTDRFLSNKKLSFDECLVGLHRGSSLN